MAIKVITQIFQIVGQPCREVVNSPEYNLNPLLLKQINDSLSKVETDDPKYAQPELSLIHI